MVRNNNSFICTFLSIVVVSFLANRLLTPITMVFAIVLLYMMAHEGKVALYMNQTTKLFIVIAGIGIVYMVLSIFGGFSVLESSHYAVKETERGIIYILIVQIIVRSKVDARKYISIWNILLTLSVVVAILQFTRAIDMNTMLKSFYGDSIQFHNTRFTVLPSFRCGSIFVNPNVFACFLAARPGSHLAASREYGCGFMRNIVVYLLCIIGFVLAGSCTGFVLGAVTPIYHLFTEGRANQGYAMRFLGTMLSFFLIFVLLMNLTGNIGSSILDNLRLFKVDEGMSNSFGGKVSIFTNLIEQMQPWNYLVGYGPFDYSSFSSLLVDFDLGYFTVYYGLIGIGLYVAMLRSFLHYEFMDGTTDHRLPRMLVVIMTVSGLTAGTYFNLRIFAIYMPMLLPMLANNREGIEARDMGKYILSVVGANGQNNARSKTGNDVLRISQECGYKLIPLYESNQVRTRVQDIIFGVIVTYSPRNKLVDGDVVSVQYPLSRLLIKNIFRILRRCKSKIRIATLIHNIDYLRDIPLGDKGVNGIKVLELSLLGSSDYLICHNPFMIRVL